MDRDDAARRRAIREAINDRVRRFPRASDTASGVAEWWLAAVGSPVSAAEAEAVLEELVQARRLHKLRLPGGTVLYMAPPADATRND